MNRAIERSITPREWDHSRQSWITAPLESDHTWAAADDRDALNEPAAAAHEPAARAHETVAFNGTTALDDGIVALADAAAVLTSATDGPRLPHHAITLIHDWLSSCSGRGFYTSSHHLWRLLPAQIQIAAAQITAAPMWLL